MNANRKDLEQKRIAVYWWNFRQKTLDFKGSYKDYLKIKGITLRECSRRGFDYYRFKISAGSSEIVFIAPQNNYTQAADDAIKLFLTLMGDKTQFEAAYRTYRLNWY